MTHHLKTTVQNRKIVLDAPIDLANNQEIEVIVFPINKPVRKIDLSTYMGRMKSGLTLEEHELELNKLRDEWDRIF